MSIGNGELCGLSVVGEMSIIAQPDPANNYYVDIAVADTYGTLTGFIKDDESVMDVDGTLGTFTILVGGRYKFDGVASLHPNAGMDMHFAVFVEDVIKKKIETGLDFQNSQDTNTFSGTGILRLNQGDVVTVRGKSSNVPVRVTINHMNISLHRVGH